MVRRVLAGVGMCLVIAACSSYGPSQTEPLDPATWTSDDSYNWQTCPLTDWLASSSHLLDVTITATITVEMPSPPVYGLARRDREPAPVLADLTDVRVEEVIFERTDDPRAEVYPSFNDDPDLTVLSRRNGGAIIELAGDDAEVVDQRLTITTGQYRVGSIEEWPIHLALHVDDSGDVDFVGPCASEYARQLDSMVTNVFPELEDTSKVEQITGLLASALETDVGGNLKHFARPAAAREMGDGQMPSSVAPDVRRVHFVVVPSGLTDGAFALQSSIGNGSEFFAVFHDRAEPYLSEAIVSEDGLISLANGRLDQTRSATPLETAFRGGLEGIDALRIDLDVETMTTEFTPIDLSEIAKIVPIAPSVDELRQALDRPVLATRGTSTVDWIPAS